MRWWLYYVDGEEFSTRERERERGEWSSLKDIIWPGKRFPCLLLLETLLNHDRVRSMRNTVSGNVLSE